MQSNSAIPGGPLVKPTRVAILFLASALALPGASADEAQGGPGGWQCWQTSRRVAEASKYTELTQAPRPSAHGRRVLTPAAGDPRPRAELGGAPPEHRLVVMPEKDGLVSSGQGDLIAGWRCPEAGSWRISMTASNVGTDVRGGDGGWMHITVLSPDDVWDNRFARRNVRIPSSAQPSNAVEVTDLLALEKGDAVLFRFQAGIDGYADRFDVRVRIVPSREPGRSIPARGVEGFLASPPAKRPPAAPPMRPGLFWLGTNGKWSNGPYAKEAIAFIRRFAPNLAVVMSDAFPEELDPPPFYLDWNIPAIIQNYGQPYVPYYLATQAFEIDWKGNVLDTPGDGSWTRLWGGGHAVSMPSDAFRTAFRSLAQSSMRSGYSGMGFCDMVWFWAAGRGRAGFHPETIAAFRSDLLGEDEGLEVHRGDGSFDTVLFRDYANYYFGGMPEPGDLGLDTWADYRPLSHDEFADTDPVDAAQQSTLFDVLVHYEWLKAAQFIGRAAREEGGFFQCMGNPEDMANGVDTLFASRLRDVGAISEEYFKTPEYLDGAYHRHPYLISLQHGELQAGTVLEGGHGGNNWPYYAHELAYAIAYELTLATQSQHLEGDFWPSQSGPFSDLRQGEFMQMRYRQLLSYALAFRHALEDGAARIEPDFISVTSRRLFRPWGEAWRPWSHLFSHLDASADVALVHAGFNVACIGEDGLARFDASAPVMIYSPDPATELGFERLLDLVRSGRVGEAIVPASSLTDVVTRRMRPRAMSAHRPAWAADRGEAGVVRGIPRDSATGEAMRAEELEIRGPRYSLDGAEALLELNGRALVSTRRAGEGRITVLLFDPVPEENRAAAQIVFEWLLKRHGIEPRWKAEPGTVARLYEAGDLRIVGVHNEYARDWGRRIIRPDNKGHYVPYRADTSTRVAVRADPDTPYRWTALPSGAGGSATSDAGGWVDLGFDGTTHEIFFLLPDGDANRERLERLADRRAEWSDAMALGAEPPPPGD
jgi:hypothetical protein